MTDKNLSQPSMITVYIFSGLLTIAAFLLGVLYSDVRSLRQGSKNATNTTAPGTEVVEKTPIVDHLKKITKLNEAKIKSCIQDAKYKEYITKQSEEGSSVLGVQGTPQSFILDRNGKMVAVTGADLASLKARLGELVDGKTPASSDLGPRAMTEAESKALALTDKDHVRGPENAPYTMIIYTDFECPFCTRWHEMVNDEVHNKAEYKDKVKVVLRHYPLSFHPSAMPLAEVSECIAAENGNEAFFEFADKHFAEMASGLQLDAAI